MSVKTFTITLLETELSDLAAGIMEMPAKKANPLMQKIQQQVNDQLKPKEPLTTEGFPIEDSPSE
jgi:hypothetical protein